MSTPAQQDEADIVREVGAETDDESGELLADEERIRKLGAVDSDSVIENRRLEGIVGKKRANKKNVAFNAGDLLTKYETLIKFWPPNTLDISVKRLTGSPVQQLITSRPRSGSELFDALRAVHGQHEEAKYEIKFFDNNSKEFRGNGNITMPDSRPAPQQGQPMQYPPPGYPPGYPPPYGHQPYPPPQAQPQAGPQPMPPVVVNGPDMSAMMTTFQQMFDMFQRMQPPAAAAAAPAQQQPYMPPPPPPGADMPTMMAWMKQMFDLFQSMQPPAAGQGPRGYPQQPQTPNPMMTMMGVPPVQPPPGTLFVPGFGYVPVDRLMEAISSVPGGGGGGFRPPYRGGPHRPPYGLQNDGGQPHYPGRYDPQGRYDPNNQQQQQPPKTAAESFRDSITMVRSAVAAAHELNSLLGTEQGAAEPQVVQEEDDSPIRVIDTGPAKIVVNRSDGTMRFAETGFANLDKVLKWMGEQREAIQKSAHERQLQEQQQQPRQQLPPGYVEVGPGYQPPPGFVAVPVDQVPPSAPQGHGQGLPPPPTNVPPPIQQAPQSRTWGAPPMPFDRGQG